MVTICGLNDEAEGIFYIDDKEKSVAFVLPGEQVEVSSDRKGRNWFLERVIKPSESRIPPDCPYFTRCGGCTLQHVHSTLYDEIKIARARRAAQDLCDIDPLIKVTSGQRRRANLEAVKKDEHVFLGFHRLKSHQIINIDTCLALSPNLRILLKPLRDVLSQILENKQKAQIFLLESDTGIDLILEICFLKELQENHRLSLRQFAIDHQISRLMFRHRKFRDIIHASSKISIQFGNHAVPFDAYSFAQATKEADQVLTDLVIKALPERKDKIADLFSGRGTFSFPLSEHGEVDAYESEPRAIEDVLSIHPPFALKTRDLFENPLTSEELNHYDVVVLDPPRAGAKAQIKELTKSRVPFIIYVSCNPSSFKEDAQILSSKYKLIKVTPVDQFSWTAHLEVVAVFKKA